VLLTAAGNKKTDADFLYIQNLNILHALPPTQGPTAPCQSLRCQLEALQEFQLLEPHCHHESAERGDCAGSAWTLLLRRGREKEEVEEEEEEDTDNLKSNDLHLTSCRKKTCKRKQPGNSLSKVSKHF
jgi:hypothetical protein